MSKKTTIDYDALKNKALSQLRSGTSLYGKDGAFGPLLQEFLQAALEEELNTHLDVEQRQNGNRKNGHTSKSVKTSSGTIDIENPRDRSSTFDPQIIKKRETILDERLESKIL